MFYLSYSFPFNTSQNITLNIRPKDSTKLSSHMSVKAIVDTYSLCSNRYYKAPLRLWRSSDHKPFRHIFLIRNTNKCVQGAVEKIVATTSRKVATLIWSPAANSSRMRWPRVMHRVRSSWSRNWAAATSLLRLLRRLHVLFE